MENVQEEWRPVNGDFDGWRYEVSNLGRVRNASTKLILAAFANNKGRLRVCLYRKYKFKHVLVHRLVAAAFLERPSNPNADDVNHKDGNPQNNRIDNLEWLTRRENIRHALSNGLYPGKPFLLLEMIREIRTSPESSYALEKRMGVSKTTINRVRSGQVYADVL